MKAIQINTEDSTLYLGDYSKPQAAPNELLIEVAATALNRADLLQRSGNYPPPADASPIMGLELAGTVIGWGTEVTGFQIGDRVCGLLPGGGYAQQAVLPASLALRMPDEMSFTEATAIPEVFLTAFQALHLLADLQAGENVLIHAGGSGVGTAAIQLARLAGAENVIVTASEAKHDFCQKLGADHTIDYRTEDFAARVLDITESKGVDVLIDFVGGPNFASNLKAMAPDGRIVMLAFLGGVNTPEAVNLLPILRKRIKIMGSTLRARSLAYKATLTGAFRERSWPLFANKELLPIIDSVYNWEQVEQAHQYMAANKNTGKIVMNVS